MSENIPSQDPADDGSMGSMLRNVIRKYMLSTDGMLPATVVAYNRTTNRATIAPSIDMVSTGGGLINRAILASIPVLALGGGGFCITFPLKPGDTGWIEASDRDISLWLQGAGKRSSRPNTHRIHSFSDGRFIPDVLAAYELPENSDGALCIQSARGSAHIIINDERIDINATGGVWINGIRHDTHVHGGVQSGGSNTQGPKQ